MSDLAMLAAALPKCAVTCLISAIGESTCIATNQTCICSNQELNARATGCITQNCTIRETLTTQNLTSTLCGIAPRVDHSYVSVLIAFVTVSAVCVSLRVIARLHTRVPLWWDDFVVALSFLGSVAFAAIALAVKPRGLGTDIWNIQFDDITIIFKALYTLFVLYITSRDLVRLSILLFYYRIFGHIKMARLLIRLTFVLIIACCIAFGFAIIFGCTPLDYYWTGWDGEHDGHCISTNGIFWAGAFIVIAMDFWIILIPLFFIVRLNLPLRKRILSGVMFAFGLFVIFVSLFRIKTINRFTLSRNPTVDFVEVGIWSGLELYVGIICACLPNFYYLLTHGFAWICLRVSTFGATKSHSCDPRSGTGSDQHLHNKMSASDQMVQMTPTAGVKAL
ncbi:hypothetical protein F5B22DRAFT_628298 [Xylaria bambusicola]|uniref:uncharacterized protein n=1 Tax=Xylaria bambusicola TaxID=326684 RepID=UPI002007A296|nr:uncharacterized protein F5B22DRAFT_628298 [Xylaria bambusicola]KAI0505356.1 hypothetical protein F5B22DRAFT_628298 [Xylaria bambusicola]